MHVNKLVSFETSTSKTLLCPFSFIVLLVKMSLFPLSLILKRKELIAVCLLEES